MLDKLENTYLKLPSEFYSSMQAQPVQAPKWIDLNTELAIDLGLDAKWLKSDEGLNTLSGNEFPQQIKPLSMVYAGHQFGNWVPQLGDGRAMLLGEVVDGTGRRFDIQLKGSGRTPYSRGGDGRAGLGPVLLEYLMSEAMHALGISTTRALAAVLTGDMIRRQTPQQGAVLTRIARAHIRVGTFEYFSEQNALDAIQDLVEYALQRLYPENMDSENSAISLFSMVMRQQAKLIASWQAIGFIHGVMNTDNCAISGETIDYGPCAFMDTYEAKKVFSSIDSHGRYAYCNQPAIGHWNLAQLAYALLPAIDDDKDKAIEKIKPIIETYPTIFQQEWLQGMRNKLGLYDALEGDLNLAKDLFIAMEEDSADFTCLFQQLIRAHEESTALPEMPAVNHWLSAWRVRLDADSALKKHQVQRMRTHNPVYIPRNHQIDKAIKDANQGDYRHFELLKKVFAEPYKERNEYAEFSTPPTPDQIVHRTFCGT